MIYNEVSVDGRVVGFDSDVGRYYARGFRWRSDAILMGSATAQAFGPSETADAQHRPLRHVEKVPVYRGFEHLVTEPRPLLVVPDSAGRVRCWADALAQPWYRGILVLVSASTPAEYRAYLDRRGVGQLVAGQGRVDLAEAMRLLARDHGIRSIRTDGGGGLNGALLAAGLVDELGLILNPSVSAEPEGQGVVRLPAALPGAVPLDLVETERLDDGALWLRYRVRPRISFVRLPQVPPAEVEALLNDPRIRRHLPLASDVTGQEAAEWVRGKDAQWEEHGYGPEAVLVDGRFAGWGGFQREEAGADLALVLSPEHWGLGEEITRRLLARGFGELGLDEVTIALPYSRNLGTVLARFGFEPDGVVEHGGTRFRRYRLTRDRSYRLR